MILLNLEKYNGNNNNNNDNNNNNNFFERSYLFIYRLRFTTIHKIRPFTSNQILLIIVKIMCKTLDVDLAILYYRNSIYDERY